MQEEIPVDLKDITCDTCRGAIGQYRNEDGSVKEGGIGDNSIWIATEWKIYLECKNGAHHKL